MKEKVKRVGQGQGENGKVKVKGEGEQRRYDSRCADWRKRIPVKVKTTTRVWRAFRNDERELVSESVSEDVVKITKREFLSLAFIRFGRA